MNRVVFKTGVSRLVSAFPNKHMDFELMWTYLKDLDDEQFKGAVDSLLMEEEAINKATNVIAIIRNRAFDISTTNAEEAWSEVLKAIGRYGSYGNPTFSNNIIAQAVTCIGWRNLCMSEKIGIERAHFFKVYDTFKKRSKQEVIRGRDTDRKKLPGTRSLPTAIKDLLGRSSPGSVGGSDS